ncbi:ABC transporter ATP-binding protein [Reinekea thalattae]|uniref:ABC transporter ATP-binding protein n=1 Tax=Reinekea thalattae TaxID=2593301 RepID=A0A5C8Z8N7_9GAMM|nr:ABC transporter ATP-binding protein [Reinekea thalattae]TXR53714.1 ABC transporter ATP-binding protein [Reinekea thalattae]
MKPLTLNQIGKSFAGKTVLDSIDLDVEAGCFLTLLGPSGCGKTTLLRIIAGLEQPDSGTLYNEHRLLDDPKKNRHLAPQQRHFGFVFQDYGLWPHMNVAANVAFPLQMAKVSKQEIKNRVKQALTDVHMQDHADKRPTQLSGGQKQRISIARALVARPKLILFDEPLSNLDANLREELGHDIRRLAREQGLTCINVTHDRREAQLLSDKIVLLKDGRCHQQGTPEELFHTPIDAWAAKFLDAGNLLAEKTLWPERAENSSDLILIPRSAIAITTQQNEISAQVISCRYLDDRHEIVVEKSGERLKFYQSKSAQIGQTVHLKIDENTISRYCRKAISNNKLDNIPVENIA